MVFPRRQAEGWRDAGRAAWREFDEEVGYKLGGLQFLMRRVKSDGPDGPVDYSTFVSEVPEEFLPKLNHEGSAFAWLDPSETLGDNEPTAAIADSAEIEIPPMLNEQGEGLEDPMDDPDDLDDELADLILSELEALDERLAKIEEDCAADSATPVHGAAGAAELEAALEGDPDPLPARSSYESPLNYETDFGLVPVRVTPSRLA